MKTRLWPCMLVLALAAGAQADDDTDRALQKLCDYTKVDDRGNIRRTLEEGGIELRRMYSDVKCGKDSLLRFAAANGAVEAATLIISKAGKKVITEKEGDGMTAMEWAQKRHDSADGGSKPKIKAVIDLMQSKQ